MPQATHIADAPVQNWVERFAPPSVLPFAQLMRLDRPIGWWLLLLPCWWGLALATVAHGGGVPSLWLAALFLIGAIVMRGAGCTLNDLADREFDAKVERTKLRPIASGRVSVKAAVVTLALQCLVGLAILLQFNWYTVLLGAASLLIVAVYPFMKRFTYWPQFVLGLAFNWGALLGWAAVHGSVSAPALLLYAAGISWTLAYDTIYAHQDKEDDILIGVKSTALLFADRTPYWLTGFFALTLGLLCVAFHLAGTSVYAFLGIAAAATHAVWQLHNFNSKDSALCLKLFKSNRTFGLIILFFLVLDSLLQ